MRERERLGGAGGSGAGGAGVNSSRKIDGKFQEVLNFDFSSSSLSGFLTCLSNELTSFFFYRFLLYTVQYVICCFLSPAGIMGCLAQSKPL